MAAKLLDKQRIPGLLAATIEAGLEGHRAALLQGIDARFVASLPVSPAPSAQILTDLHGLNLSLGDGSVPLGRWLENALLLAGPRAAGAVFEAALVELGLPVPAQTTAAASPRGAAPRSISAESTDVVILVAVQDELEAVLALGQGGREGWEEKRDHQGFPYFRRVFSRENGGALAVAAAWIGAMGQDVDTALRGQQLVAELSPACLAMCGICGGWREKVALGDIVVADRLYLYDHGKLIAGEGVESGFYHHLEGYGPGRVWKMDAAFFAQTFKLDALLSERPLSLAGQRAWLLRALHAHETEGAESPEKHPDRRALVPAWKHLVPRLRGEGLVAITGAKLSLTAKGLEAAGEDLVINIDGVPSEPELRVHVGAMATGRTVRQDPTLFDRLVRIERATLAVDMEGAAVAKVAEWFGKRSLVVKAVSDHADDDKDDRYRAFACKASATFLLAFLQRHLEPDPPGGRSRGADDTRDHEGSLSKTRDERRRSGFLGRIEQICELRSAGAHVMQHPTPYPFGGALEIFAPRERVIHRELHVALEQVVTGEALTVLAGEILPLHRRYGHLSCKLVHLGPPSTPELALRAQRYDVELITFESYQGLVDLGRYSAWLSRRLEMDREYPSWLYVEQPAGVSFARQEATLVPDALAALGEILDTPGGRFALILGDFGAGKSFLFRELARRLLADRGAIVPVLVEMRSLEKTLSLRSLLAQHFTDADVGSVDIDAFLYMLREGRVVLLFDGFDELAVRVTYDQVLQHFATITGAVAGKAKVIVSSRRQHFLNDGQVTAELARNAEQLQGYRLLELRPFEEAQIREFLGNRLKDDAEADARYRLIHDVKDLLGLSHNPRMLSFIADLEPSRLTAAKEAAGEITPAKLYELLLDRWLTGESSRTQVTKDGLWRAVRTFACTLWVTPGNAVDLERLPRDLVPRMEAPRQALSEEEARLVLGSRSLLKRDASGMFSFVHRSVLEWLVASEAGSELEAKGSAGVLDADAMSPLMARFFVDLAGKAPAEAWARRVFAAGKGGTAEKNALLVAGDLGLDLVVNLEERDLRGVSLVGLNLRGANLRRVNLEGVVLQGYDLTGADLARARLARADLRGAMLRGANLARADLSLARISGADVSEADLTGAILLGAKLFSVKGLSAELSALAERDGAAVVTGVGLGETVLPPSECNAVAHHPGGHVLASAHEDGTIRLWDVASGKLLHALCGHTDVVWSIAFSLDGRSLASCSADRTVRLWDTASGAQRLSLSGHVDNVLSVAFSADGRSLASGSADTTVRLWDTAAGAQRLVIHGHTDNVWSVAFSPDGRSLVSGSADRTVRLWDAASGAPGLTLSGHEDIVLSVAFSLDGRSLASGSADKTACLWDTASGAQRLVLSGHTDGVESVAFSPDGRSLASGSADKTVRLWDTAFGVERLALSGHSGAVVSVGFSPEGRSLASGSTDGSVCLWDAVTGTQRLALSGHANRARSVGFSPDGRSLVSGSEDGTVRLWDIATGTQRLALSGHANSVLSVVFSPDGRSLVTGSHDATVRLWDSATGAQRFELTGHTNSVLSVAVSPDGRSLASGSHDQTVRLWDIAPGAQKFTLSGHLSSVWSVAFSPDGRVLASASRDKTVCLWDTVSGTLRSELSGHTASVRSVAFSPDGRVLASASRDKTVRLWDTASGAPLLVLSGHTNRVRTVAFSPDGLTLASGSQDRTVRLWDSVSGSQRLVLCGHTNRVRSLAFSPEGRSLASSSDDGTIRLWDVASGRCLTVLLATAEGWVSFLPEEHPGGPPRGAFKLVGDIAGSFWHRIGLARFEPGELDEFLPEGQRLRLPDDYSFLPPRR